MIWREFRKHVSGVRHVSGMTSNTALADNETLPIDALFRARGIANDHQAWRAGGLAPQTMRRLRRGEGIRADAIGRLAAFLQVSPGALRCVLDATRLAILTRGGGR